MVVEPASPPARLAGYVRAFGGRRLVVLGDLVVDEFLHGDIVRVSREAPVLILEHTRTDSVPGGGGNSVANVRALGAHPLPVGVVGDDEPGRRLLAALRRLRVDTAGIVVARGYRTPCKTRILAGGTHTRRQQIVRVDSGAARGELPPATRTAVRRALRRALGEAEGLLVADYSYGAASPKLLEGFLPRLLARGLTVTVDSRARVASFPGVTACTPNQEELEQALGLATLADDEVEAAARKLLRRSGNRVVLVTRGAKGMLLARRRRPAVAVPAYGSDEVVDVTGAGDTVIAVFTLALVAGAAFDEAARLSNYAAGLVVTKSGTATTSRRELTAAIQADSRPAASARGGEVDA